MANETETPKSPEPQGPVAAEVDDDRPTFVPAVDIYENDDGAVLVADLPGCDEGSVEIHIEDGVLTIRGRVKAHAPEGLDLTAGEYRLGDFERSFTVSELVDTDHIEAAVKDGVLHLTLPKAEAAKPRKIQIKTA